MKRYPLEGLFRVRNWGGGEARGFFQPDLLGIGKRGRERRVGLRKLAERDLKARDKLYD